MAITSSAKKAIRASARKRIFNVRTERKMDVLVKDVKKLISAKKIDEAKKMIPSVYTAIDKAIKTNYIKKNTGARMKSRIMHSINKK